MVKPTRLYVSLEAKAVLDRHRILPPRRYPQLVPEVQRVPRNNIASKFHMDYADTRPERLKYLQVFSDSVRPVQVLTSLHPEHIEAVLGLTLKWDVMAKRMYPNTEAFLPAPRGEVLNNLLSTFLDAVLLEYIIPIERQYE